jgi:predicted ATP-dependent endonuclease of OLD family
MAHVYEQEVRVNRPPFLGGDAWHLRGLNAITVIFGKNGSGKSLLMRAWRDLNRAGHHYVAPERTGELDYQPNFQTQQSDPEQRGANSARNFVPDYRRQIVARIQSYLSIRGDTRGDSLPRDPGELERLLQDLLPDFSIRMSAKGNPPYVLTRLADDAVITSIDQLSSGEAQTLTLGLDVLTIAAIWDIERSATRVMLVDEPDAHIHPDLQVRFADFLVRVARTFSLQLVIATHSTTLLAALGQFGAGQTGVVYLGRLQGEAAAEPFSSAMREISACLGGHALMGSLFSVPLMLVEGDDDYRIWSQVPRHHIAKLAAIPSHGDEIKVYQRTLERLFAAIREKGSPLSGYALLDGDKSKPENNPSTPQDHVRFIRLACRESENLYLTDQVLAAIGVTWAEAIAKVVEAAQSGAFGNKSDSLREIGGMDRMRGDFKQYIGEISRSIDPKNVDWTIRVGQAIGREKPTGQLEEFLGPEVMTALWS